VLRGNKSVSGGETAALIWLGLVRKLAVRDGNDGEHKNPLLRFGEGKGEVDGSQTPSQKLLNPPIRPQAILKLH
jgi:hypothetical protein